MDADQATCGKGLAANADLPARLADLIAARAEVLERHTGALDSSNALARREVDVYTTLAREHREIADALTRLSREMAASRDLPMAPHDVAVLRGPQGQAEAFARFVTIERGLLELLQRKLRDEEALTRR